MSIQRQSHVFPWRQDRPVLVVRDQPTLDASRMHQDRQQLGVRGPELLLEKRLLDLHSIGTQQREPAKQRPFDLGFESNGKPEQVGGDLRT
jgi:hypothetical protein